MRSVSIQRQLGSRLPVEPAIFRSRAVPRFGLCCGNGKAMADHRNGRGVVVRFQQCAAQRRGCAKQRKQPSRSSQREHLVRYGDAGQRHHVLHERHGCLEQICAVAPAQIVFRRHAEESTFGAGLFHPDQLRGRAIRQRPENDGIRDAEAAVLVPIPSPKLRPTAVANSGFRRSQAFSNLLIQGWSLKR
jgi:hypothetical protein